MVGTAVVSTVAALIAAVIMIVVGIAGAIGKLPKIKVAPSPIVMIITVIMFLFASAYFMFAVIGWKWYETSPIWILIAISALIVLSAISPLNHSKTTSPSLIVDNALDFFRDRGYLILKCPLFGVDYYVVKDDSWSLLKISPFVNSEDVKNFTTTLSRKGYSSGYIVAQTFTLAALDDIGDNPHLLPLHTREYLTSQKLTKHKKVKK
jgi:hypothetical protein